MDLVEFEAARCLDGYRIIFDLTAPNGKIESASDHFEVYRPAEFPALFRKFADMPATAEGMLDFAKNFGLLGGLGSIPAADLKGGSEPLDSMLELQADLRRAIRLYDARDWSGVVECYNTGWGRGALRSKLRSLPRGKVALILVPTNLNQFMWLQFALYGGGNAKLLRCERCSAPFLVGTGTGRRETAKFCSNACKVAAFRARKEGRRINA